MGNNINQDNCRFSHRIGDFRWIYVDDQDWRQTYNIQYKTLFGWHTIKTVETETEKEGVEKCEQILSTLTM